MKVFILTTELNSKNGWGRYSLSLVDALAQNGVETMFATDKNGHNETNGHVINILPDYRNYNKNYLMALWYALRLRRHAKRCDVIHSFVEPYSYIAYWLSKLTGKRYFITTHGSYGVMPFRLSAARRYFHKKSFISAEKVICVSEYTKKRLAEFNPSNLLVINNGIDFKRFCHASIPALEERENYILSVGALKHRKGQHISLQAFGVIADAFKDARYFIVGDRSDPDYFNQLKKITIDLRIENRVEFLSSISDEELIKLYKKAKVFVLTSISKGTHFEGFGLVYLEANACGLPVIGSMDSGAEDAIEDGKTGFLVQQNNADAIAGVVNKVFSDKELWKKISENGRVWAKEHDWALIVKKYIVVYEQE